MVLSIPKVGSRNPTALVRASETEGLPAVGGKPSGHETGGPAHRYRRLLGRARRHVGLVSGLPPRSGASLRRVGERPRRRPGPPPRPTAVREPRLAVHLGLERLLGFRQRLPDGGRSPHRPTDDDEVPRRTRPDPARTGGCRSGRRRRRPQLPLSVERRARHGRPLRRRAETRRGALGRPQPGGIWPGHAAHRGLLSPGRRPRSVAQGGPHPEADPGRGRIDLGKRRSGDIEASAPRTARGCRA